MSGGGETDKEFGKILPSKTREIFIYLQGESAKKKPYQHVVIYT